VDILKLIQSGESETLEFKSAFGKEVIITLAAFANTKGGKVIMGIDDAGRPTGIDIGPETEQRYLNEMGDFLMVGVSTTPTKTPTKTPIKTPTKKVAGLTSLERKIFHEIKKDNAITFNRIATALSISRYTVVEYVNKLKIKGVIKRQGGSRAGYWEILISDDESE